MTETVNDKIYEESLKEFILDNKYLLGDIGDSVVVFEKNLTYSKQRGAKKTRADALVFSANKGLVGIEIKTKQDSHYRLKRQLEAYTLNCNYVYVLVHDKHIKAIEDILNSNKNLFSHVGIISYTEFKGQIVSGIYKESLSNPHYSAFHALNMLHKNEITNILSGFRHSGRVIAEETGINAYGAKDRSEGMHGTLVASVYPRTMKKRQLINNMIKKVGAQEATNLMCQLFINNRQNPERLIKLRHFRVKKDGESLS